ncbi:hypothetical protein Tco_0213011 [Tanacetum coccineum]
MEENWCKRVAVDLVVLCVGWRRDVEEKEAVRIGRDKQLLSARRSLLCGKTERQRTTGGFVSWSSGLLVKASLLICKENGGGDLSDYGSKALVRRCSFSRRGEKKRGGGSRLRPRLGACRLCEDLLSDAR